MRQNAKHFNILLSLFFHVSKSNTFEVWTVNQEKKNKTINLKV